MSLEETVEERLARKLAKKEARDKGEKKTEIKDTEEKSEAKVSKKRKASDEESASPIKSKKAIKQEISDDAPRRRTRSISNAEEVYPVGMSPEDFRKEHQLQITGNAESGSGQYACPAPMTSFASTPFAQPIRKALDAAGFPNPTPTQAQVWPIALQGRDVITVAKTGSGNLKYLRTCEFLFQIVKATRTIICRKNMWLFTTRIPPNDNTLERSKKRSPRYSSPCANTRIGLSNRGGMCEVR